MIEIPKQAVITVQSEAEAIQLLNFLLEDSRVYSCGDLVCDWGVYGPDTCWDIEPDGRIMFSPRQFYEEEIAAYEDSPPYSNYEYGTPYSNSEWIPRDKSLRFISTPDFIARCGGVYTNEDITLDVSDLL